MAFVKLVAVVTVIHPIFCANCGRSGDPLCEEVSLLQKMSIVSVASERSTGTQASSSQETPIREKQESDDESIGGGSQLEEAGSEEDDVFKVFKDDEEKEFKHKMNEMKELEKRVEILENAHATKQYPPQADAFGGGMQGGTQGGMQGGMQGGPADGGGMQGGVQGGYNQQSYMGPAPSTAAVVASTTFAPTKVAPQKKPVPLKKKPKAVPAKRPKGLSSGTGTVLSAEKRAAREETGAEKHMWKDAASAIFDLASAKRMADNYAYMKTRSQEAHWIRHKARREATELKTRSKGNLIDAQGYKKFVEAQIRGDSR